MGSYRILDQNQMVENRGEIQEQKDTLWVKHKLMLKLVIILNLNMVLSATSTRDITDIKIK